MPTPVIHVGETPILRRTVKDQDNAVVDVSGATTKDLILQDPSGNNSTVAMAFTNSGTDGKVQYQTLVATFDEEGRWRMQIKLAIPAGTFYTLEEEIEVVAVL